MAKYHFVEDYERKAQNLGSSRQLDKAMSLAVGVYACCGVAAHDGVFFL